MVTGAARVLGLSVVVSTLLPAHARADEFAWPGQGTIHVDVPAGWRITARPSGDRRYEFRAEPKTASAPVVQFTLLVPPPDERIIEDVRPALEALTKDYVASSVEKIFDPRPFTMAGGSGWGVASS